MWNLNKQVLNYFKWFLQAACTDYISFDFELQVYLSKNKFAKVVPQICLIDHSILTAKRL